jgi:hypothetical protein
VSGDVRIEAKDEGIMAGAFSQMFCSLAPCGVGGRIVTGQRMRNCLVQVADGELTLLQAPSTLVARAPATLVEIVTPRTLRKVGSAVVLLLDGRLLAVEFDGVYRRQREYARKRASGMTAVIRTLRRTFSVGDITDLPKSMRLARQLTSEFTTALLAAGAIDRAATPTSPPR